MKIGVIKLGSRISFNANDTSGGNGEARSIIKILEVGGHEVHIYTKILKKDDLLPQYTWHNISEDHMATGGLDALLVINGNVNFFGGAEDREQILNYKMINMVCAPVFYAYCDPALTLKQLWPAFEKKEWASNWKKEQIHISRDDIIYLSQPFDIEKVIKAMGKNCVVPQYSGSAVNIVHFPFEQFPCLNEQIPAMPFDELQYDLSYGGTMRGGKRMKKMVKFYFEYPDDISVEMFGKISLEDFDEKLYPPKCNKPDFTGPVKYAEMLPKMNSALAHIVIGDPFYESINDMAQRAYESIWSNVVTFIDHDLDTLRRVYAADKELADFLYVKDRDEVVDKIRLLKSDEQVRQQILSAQLKAINFDSIKYAQRLTELLTHGHELAAL